MRAGIARGVLHLLLLHLRQRQVPRRKHLQADRGLNSSTFDPRRKHLQGETTTFDPRRKHLQTVLRMGGGNIVHLTRGESTSRRSSGGGKRSAKCRCLKRRRMPRGGITSRRALQRQECSSSSGLAPTSLRQRWRPRGGYTSSQALPPFSPSCGSEAIAPPGAAAEAGRLKAKAPPEADPRRVAAMARHEST